MSGATSRRKGYTAENEVVKHLRDNGFPYAERRAPGTDGPDITGTPGIAWEIKNQAKMELASWVDQAETQRAAIAAPYAPVIHKRKGVTDVGRWYATLPVNQLLSLLEEAGYAAPTGNTLAEYRQKVRLIAEARALRGNHGWAEA